MKKIAFSLFISLALVGAILLGFARLSAHAAGGAALSLAVAGGYDGHDVQPGEQFTFAATLTNTGSVTANYIYATSILTGVLFVEASENLQTNTYRIGPTEVVTEVESISWQGALAPQERRQFTFTVQATDPLPRADFFVSGQLFNMDTGHLLVAKQVWLSVPPPPPPNFFYLPLVAKEPAGLTATPTATTQPPTATPSPTATTPPTVTVTPTPTPSVTRLAPTIAGGMVAQDPDYYAALAGSNAQGDNALYGKSEELYPTVALSLVQCNFMELTYRVNRAVLEFDTSAVLSYTEAWLEFDDHRSYPGPPAHTTEIYRGTWDQLVVNLAEIPAENWDAQGALLATVPGHTGLYPETVTATIPISPGGITKIALKTSTEGTVPALNSCNGGPNPGLGGSLYLPYLHIRP